MLLWGDLEARVWGILGHLDHKLRQRQAYRGSHPTCIRASVECATHTIRLRARGL